MASVHTLLPFLVPLYLVLHLSCGTCNIMLQKPPCALLDWKGQPIKAAFEAHITVTYFRHESNIYTPFSAFSSLFRAMGCLKADVSYHERRLRIVLYCNITANQTYTQVIATDRDLERTTKRWKNCRRTSYRIHYDPLFGGLYLQASMAWSNGKSGEIFLVGNEWSQQNIQSMDSEFQQKYAPQGTGQCNCTNRLEMAIMFDAMGAGERTALRNSLLLSTLAVLASTQVF